MNKSTTNGVTLQRSNSLTSVTSTAGVDDSNGNLKEGGNHEEYVRICRSCQQILQRRYDQIRFKKTDKDEVLVRYEVNSISHKISQNLFFVSSILENYRSSK